VTQGAKALAVMPSGWTEITSVQLSSLGQIKSALTYDVSVPSTPIWGETRAILLAPSVGLWADLGSQNLAALPAGQYSKVTLPVPSWVQTALEGTYTDLRVRIIINAQVLSSPYLLDNIEIAEAGTTEPPQGTDSQFSVVIPVGQTRQSMFLSASEYLQVDDRVELNLSGQVTNVAGLGSPGVQFGSAVSGHTSIHSVGNVWLRSQTEVEGFVRTEGIIDKQDATVTVLGAEQPNTAVPRRTLSWAVVFPASSTSLPVIEREDELSLAPGAYQHLNVHGGRVFLRSGTYYFDSFTTEPESQIRITNAGGAVFIYVKSGFTYKGAFVYEAGSREGQVLVGHLGSTLAFLQAPFVGTMVAPNGKIELHRPISGQHKGSWFAKQIQVFSDSHILHLPFGWHAVGDEPPDTDGDGPTDAEDPCPLDPNKTDPLVCGCNVSEVDSDLDLVPDCIDPCPNDAGKQDTGSCGCADQDNLRPAGTRCVVDACSGSRQEATCDGQGRCGTPTCDPIPGSCVFKVFRDSGYWICSAAVGWEQAETLCNAEPGRYLVKVDDRIENLWVSSALTFPTWLGGSDLSVEARWFWSSNGARDGTLYWMDGLPAGRFVNWATDRPELEGGHCMTMEGNGTWVDRDCSTAQGFVCEQPLRHIPPSIDLDKCKFYPNIACPSSGNAAPIGPCVDDSVEFPANRAEMEAIGTACAANCPTPEAPGCATSCRGFATVPPESPGCGNGFTSAERALCDLVNFTPLATCSVDNPACPPGLTCGRRYECAALDSNGQPRPCTSSADCNSGHFCGTISPFCIDPNKKTKCDDDGRAGDDCVGVCFSTVACGQVAPVCAANDDGSLLEWCSETLLCPDEPPVDVNPLTDPNSNLTEQEFPADDIFPAPEEPIGQYPLAKPAGCGGENEPDCDFAIGDHPWCNYVVDPAEAPAGRAVSDSDPAFGDKKGSAGSSGPIRFDFDPNLDISYDVPEVLPLGDSKFNASAQATATAAAQFDLFGIRGNVSILDALARLDVDRCGLEANAHLKLLGIDFLPALLGDNYDKLDSIDTSAEAREECEEAIGEFRAAVNRAQKALRDAQELIRQQKELVAQGKRLKPDLCSKLLEGLDKGLPANFPSEENPFTECGDLTPEETINLFIRYYRQQVFGLIARQAELFPEAVLSVPVPFLDDVDSALQNGDARRETQQIANINFAIGPVPMNLTIDAFIEYGMAGAMTFTLAPSRLTTAYHQGTQEEIAYVDATVTPFAGAGVTMFVGVGFDFGALSAKVGIEGDISLGVVTLPLYAGAGLGVQPVIDDRPLPADMQDMVASASNLLFPPGPPKKYRFDAFYKFGANANIHDILSGTISGKVRIKFAFFSKTWRKVIKEFRSPLPEINLVLIGGKNSAEFADDFGALDAASRMPVQFVDFKELEPPPPLPPLPEPDAGTGGSGGTAGTGGAGGAGSGGEGARPPVSLLVSNQQQDPRLIDFDPGRVDQIFYDGYCHCSEGGGSCSSTLDCCGGASFCVNGTCATCIEPFFAQCQNTSQCCQDPGQSPRACYPLFFATGPTFCQPCAAHNQSAVDANVDFIADFGECCPGLSVFRGPTSAGPQTSQPVCSGCRDAGDSCNTVNDCCTKSGANKFCTDGRCRYTTIIQ
jgi:hypothetical protein